MSYRYDFYVEDISSESSIMEIREALAELPGAQHIELVRTPQQEARVILYVHEDLLPWVIEETLMMSSGSAHHYCVRWIRAARPVPWKDPGSLVVPEGMEEPGDEGYDRPYRFTPPTSIPQALAWIRLLAQVRRGEVVP